MNAKTVRAIRKASKLLRNNDSQYNQTKAFYNGLNKLERNLFMKQTHVLIQASKELTAIPLGENNG